MNTQGCTRRSRLLSSRSHGTLRVYPAGAGNATVAHGSVPVRRRPARRRPMGVRGDRWGIRRIPRPGRSRRGRAGQSPFPRPCPCQAMPEGRGCSPAVASNGGANPCRECLSIRSAACGRTIGRRAPPRPGLAIRTEPRPGVSGPRIPLRKEAISRIKRSLWNSHRKVNFRYQVIKYHYQRNDKTCPADRTYRRPNSSVYFVIEK